VHVDPAAVEVEDVQGDLGVLGAGVRVGDRARLRGRLGRVMQVKPGYAGLVDPGAQDAPDRISIRCSRAFSYALPRLCL